MRRISIVLSCLIFACIILGVGFLNQDTPEIDKSVYSYSQTENGRVFTNNYEGYKYEIPDGFTVNTDYISLRLRVESEDTVIEIYNEKESNPDSYVNYTNKAITETTSEKIHNVTMAEREYEGNRVQELSWTRDKLQRVENDRNHYLKLDIRTNESVYTIFVKSSQEIADAEEYLNRFDLVSKVPFDAEYVKSLDKKIVSTKKNLNEETKAFYDKYFEADGLTWGLYSPAFSFDKSGLYEYEEKIDHKFPILLHYSGILDEYNPRIGELLNKAYNDGKRCLELTIQPPLNTDPKNLMYDVLDGKHDKFFTDYKNALEEFGHPVLLRLYNEMNGDWCEYSSYQMSADTDLFVKAYNYTASFFEDLDNVIFVWNPNGKSFPDFDWNDALLHLPESKYIDVVGLTMYNTGNYYEGEVWMTFDELYKDLYEETVKCTDLPLMITEFASARAGGDKEAWTEDMFEKIKNYEKIKVAVWWNGADFDTDGTVARSYYVDDSEEMIEIFKRNVKN